MIYLALCLAFLRIGLFAFGGGLAALPLIEREIVDAHHWLTKQEFLELLALSQLTPGPIAINAATFTGFKVGGVFGAFVATASFCAPSMLLTLLIGLFLNHFRDNPWVASFLRGLRPVLLALLFYVAFSVVRESVQDPFTLVLGLVSGFFLFSRRMGEIPLLLVGGILGLFWYGLR